MSDVDIVQDFIGSAELPSRMQNEASHALKRLQDECDDLRANLAAAQAELHDLRIRASLTEQWQPVKDGERVFCACDEDICNTEAQIVDGILCLEDAEGMQVSFDMGEEFAFMRRVGDQRHFVDNMNVSAHVDRLHEATEGGGLSDALRRTKK